ncbi:SSU1_3 [Sanghuangporus sanghuang]
MYIFRIPFSPTIPSHSHDRREAGLSLKDCIRRFTPAWHAAVMGTGAITIIFNIFPYSSSRGLQITALSFLIFNLILFVLLTLLTLARYILFPDLFRPSLLVHPTQSLFLGCFPMGFATILIGAVDVVYGYFGFGGAGLVWALWALWWVDVAVSVLVCFGQLYFMFTRQAHSLSRMTMIWLLPIVTLIVVSAAGVVIAQALLSLPSSSNSLMLSHVYLTMAVSTLLVTVGLMLSLSVMVIYILRLMTYKLPEGLGIFSVFLPLGPLGQAGFTYVVLGEVARSVFPVPSLSSSGDAAADRMNTANVFANSYAGGVVYVLGWVIGFVLWSFATCWVILAFLSLGDVLFLSRFSNNNMDLNSKPRTSLPFKVTFWGMIFPNGVYANLTIHLARTTCSQVLRVWGTIYSVFTVLLWVYALVRTLASLRNGSVFEELCVLPVADSVRLEGGDKERAEVEVERGLFSMPWLDTRIQIQLPPTSLLEAFPTPTLSDDIATYVSPLPFNSAAANQLQVQPRTLAERRLRSAVHSGMTCCCGNGYAQEERSQSSSTSSPTAQTLTSSRRPR